MEPRRPKHKQAPPLELPLAELERALREPATYKFLTREGEREAFPDGREAPEPLAAVHTHLSLVLLLPSRVYKVKKPVDFGFVDFSTLYKRFQACYAEVQLNQRLAPSVYAGVVPISMRRDTREISVRCDDFWTPEKNDKLDYWLSDDLGEIVEWAVHMVRLPDERTLLHIMDEGLLSPAIVTRVARKLVDFHAHARRGPKIDEFGKERVVRHNIDENFEQTQTHVGATVSTTVYQRVKDQTYAQLKALAPTIESRVENGYTCDSHGDLRLEHIYLLPNDDDNDGNKTRAEAFENDADPFAHDKFVILDCIEFNEQFRYGDPLADVAFVMMDIWRKGRPDLARQLMTEYLTMAVQDTPANKKLFLFYAAYRAVVRAKVHGFRVVDPTVSAVERAREQKTARCYWLVALELLSPPEQRPCMVLVGGLPASGKSNLAKMLAGDESTMTWLRADAIRKELAKQLASEAGDASTFSANEPEPSSADELDAPVSHSNVRHGSFEEGLYSPQMTKRTYNEILIRCVGLLREGERVVVDATFRDEAQRQRFIEAAHSEGALIAMILCECDREIVKGRLLARKNDISDATWNVYEKMESGWSVPELGAVAECAVVNTEKEKELTLRRAQGVLRKLELL